MEQPDRMPATPNRPSTLPSHYYTDPALHRAEIERWFFNKWVCAGREESIARSGDYFLANLAGESIIVTRDESGQARAMFNVCRHRGTRMCTEPEGSFEAGRIRCPYHSWTYGLDGRLLAAPHMGDLPIGDYPLHSIRAGIWEGHVFLLCDPGAPLLADLLAPLTKKFESWRMRDLRLHKRIVYDVKANWKLIVLNYNECLHCPGVHPLLHCLTDYLGAENESCSSYIGGSMGFRGGAQTMSVDGKLRRGYLPGLSAQQRRMVAYYTIYPNLLLSLHPDYMMTHTLWPESVENTRVVCEWHFHPSEMAKSGFQSDDAIEFWDRTNREDWAIVEQSQQGIRSRAYTPGPYSAREELLAIFDRTIAAD